LQNKPTFRGKKAFFRGKVILSAVKVSSMATDDIACTPYSAFLRKWKRI